MFSGICVALAVALCGPTLLVAGASDAPVADAAMAGQTATIRSLLEQGADVNDPQPDGMTALHWAALNDDADVAAMLLYAGANVSASTRLGGYTPLIMAAEDGRAAVIRALLKGGADPNATDGQGATSLMLASASGSVDAVNYLLAAGARVNAVEQIKHETALMFAAANDRTGVVNVLLDHGAEWKPTTTILDWSKVSRDDPRISPVRRRPSGGANQAAGKSAPETKLEPPTKPGGPPKAAGATSKEAEPSAPGVAVAEGGAARGNAGVAHSGARAQAGAGGANEPLTEGAGGYPALVGAQGGLTALLFAARDGYADTAQALLRHGADVNQVDPGDRTSPLLIAVINGRFDMAEQLLQAGADPNLAAANGVTPLYAVVNCVWADKALYPQPQAHKQQETDYLTMMKDLLDRGADPNARLTKEVWYADYNQDQKGLDETGATAFWRVAYSGDAAAMKVLVAHGADPNIWTEKLPPRASYPPRAEVKKDYSGLRPVPVGGPDISPLLAASGEGYGWSLTANHHIFAPAGPLPAVKYLVEVLHANVNERDAEGNTALHNAAARGDNAMIQYLVSKGADITLLNRNGQSVADMANGPVERVSPFVDTIALAERLGAKLLHACVSCGG
jgi:ankyrin repeat protein